MSQAESGAEAIAIGMFMGDQRYTLRWPDESQRLLNQSRIKLLMKCAGIFTGTNLRSLSISWFRCLVFLLDL